MITPTDAPIDFATLDDAEMVCSLTIDQRTIPLAPFRSLDLAFSCAERSTRPCLVVQGDPPWFWVVLAADAQRLVGAGYEILTRSLLSR